MVIGVGVQGLVADRYQLRDRLGSGAMGEVWRADDRLLGRPVAVKLLRTDEAADAERFRLEAQTAGRLNHPNVVGMYDFGSHHGRLYLVMELVDGWSLAQERSLRGALAPQEAAALAAQVASGLAAAHRQGVIHRDVKSANVMLSADRTAKIADFGIARFADEAAAGLTATGKIVGTADYLAPERALGRPAQPASDVYSLGCVLYELLTGRPPFRGATPLAVVQQHVDAPPAPPVRLRTGIPQELSDYVLFLLAKEPAQRPTADQAADWLTSYLRVPRAPEPDDTAFVSAPAPVAPTTSALTPRSRRARTVTHTRPQARRKLTVRAAVGGAGLALFAAATALGASLNSSEETPPSPPAFVPTTAATSVATTVAPTPASTPTSAPTSRQTREQDADQQGGRKDKHHKGKGKGHGSDD
ncbi:serine/threonine-protein kinase [Streptomyces naphthomycinicus]|uniref:serine/threonine-protein kinase n=1 Tax=Streptomyces naphthomycinicus TaxID=2872625 RepID=UPI001CECCE2C|nr:serine/threonine-protein kinase [Streptomyces sp. TML10]